MSRRDPVAGFVGFLFLTAAGLGALALQQQGLTPSVSWWTVVPFALLLGTAETLLVRFVFRREVDALNLFEAALAPALVALPGPVLMLAVAAGQAGAAVHRRNAPIKGLFNVAQWTTAAGAGSLVFAALRQGPGLAGRDLPALIAALAVVSVVNQLAFTNVMRLVSGRTMRRTFSGLRAVIVRGWLGGWLVNTGFGALFAVSYDRTAWALPFFFVPLLMLHWAGRGFATARTDRVRLAALQRTTHALAVPIDPRDGVPGFLVEILDGFEAGAVELLTPDGGFVARRPDGGDEAVVEPLPSRVVGLADLRLPGGMAAPMQAGDRMLGVLRVHERGGAEGFDDGELAVLHALAAEAAGALQKAELLDSILEERRNLFTVVDATSDGIMTIDADGVVRTWNPGLEAITGYVAKSMVGSAHAGVLRPRDAAGTDVLLERWADVDTELPADLQIVAADGTTRWLSCSYSRVPAKDERLAVLVLMARDVTRVHEVERLKEDFVATVSHELRTPLTPIKGFATMLLENGDRLGSEGRHVAAESILRSAQRLERLIVNLLEVSRVESHVLEMRDAVVPVTPVVERVVDEFRTAFSDRCIGLAVHGEPVALGSELWIEQILSNLLSNAVKYAPAPAGIEVELRVDGPAVELLVVDHGPGVPEHEADRIFERFERLDQDRQQAGTGLGLYIARELAHAMNGTLAVSTGADGGAVFALRLPAAAVQLDTAVEPRPEVPTV